MYTKKQEKGFSKLLKKEELQRHKMVVKHTPVGRLRNKKETIAREYVISKQYSTQN